MVRRSREAEDRESPSRVPGVVVDSWVSIMHDGTAAPRGWGLVIDGDENDYTDGAGGARDVFLDVVPHRG